MKTVRPNSRVDKRMILQAVLAAVIPVVVGCGVSWLAPYYVFTCTRGDVGDVSVRAQQTLLGVIPIGQAAEVFHLQQVEHFAPGARAKPAYLRLTGDRFLEFRANRGSQSVERMRGFLADANAERLRLSDGNIFFGLYVPWAISLLGLAAVVTTLSDWKEIEHGQFDPMEPVGRLARYPGVVHFAMAAYLMACLAGLVFVFRFDVVRVPVWPWLLVILGAALILTWLRDRTKVRSVFGTAGEVVREEVRNEDGGRDVIYYATIHYEVAGKEHRVQWAASNPPAQIVPVFYFPNRPAKGDLVGYQERFPWLLYSAVSVAIIVAMVLTPIPQ